MFKKEGKADKNRRRYTRLQEKYIVKCHKYNEEGRNITASTGDISESGGLVPFYHKI